jgi:hypothetical protein
MTMRAPYTALLCLFSAWAGAYLTSCLFRLRAKLRAYEIHIGGERVLCFCARTDEEAVENAVDCYPLQAWLGTLRVHRPSVFAIETPGIFPCFHNGRLAFLSFRIGRERVLWPQIQRIRS